MDIPTVGIDFNSIFDMLGEIAHNPYVLGAAIAIVIVAAFVIISLQGNRNREMVNRYAR
tara:strand:- start:287 stop:463 length:177 start_codon:yes stop_codon:yes gene_type:complete